MANVCCCGTARGRCKCNYTAGAGYRPAGMYVIERGELNGLKHPSFATRHSSEATTPYFLHPSLGASVTRLTKSINVNPVSRIARVTEGQLSGKRRGGIA